MGYAKYCPNLAGSIFVMLPRCRTSRGNCSSAYLSYFAGNQITTLTGERIRRRSAGIHSSFVTWMITFESWLSKLVYGCFYNDTALSFTWWTYLIFIPSSSALRIRFVNQATYNFFIKYGCWISPHQVMYLTLETKNNLNFIKNWCFNF